MAFLDDIREAIGGQEGPLYEKLKSELGGTASGAMLQSDVNRGVLPGRRSAWSEGMDPESLAKLDRFAWGKQGGLGGLPVAAGYELLKGLSQSGAGKLLPGIAEAMGFEDTGKQFQQDKTSSPASFGNVGAYIRGALGR